MAWAGSTATISSDGSGERFSKKRPGAQVVLHGVSMGAATVMMTTGEQLPENVRAAVEDCGYTDVWEEFYHPAEEGVRASAVSHHAHCKHHGKAACGLFFQGKPRRSAR